MPTFVIHSIGKASQKVTVEKASIKIGRDDGNDVVLPEEAVSREHALIIRTNDGRWQVSCVSETNPIVVNGKLTTQGIGLQEGTEILIGNSHMLVFSENEFKADAYISVKPTFEKSRCSRCDWVGMTSVLKRNTACPKCASTELVAAEGYTGATASQAPAKRHAATAALDPKSAKEMFSQIRAAKRSRIERSDERATPTARAELVENKPLVIGRGADPELSLRGITFGDVSIAWDGTHYAVESRMTFPAMKVNGEKVKKAQLKSGDEIAVGSNRYRFVTE